jgi:5-hydroxyisourate hydrolase
VFDRATLARRRAVRQEVQVTVSTHVLDTVRGGPAGGVGVRLERSDGTLLAAGVTDRDGRVADFVGAVEPGVYRLRFDTENYLGGTPFYPEVIVTFRVRVAAEHHHVPLVLSPFAYSTYRGS